MRPSELSVAILYMRKFDYNVPAIVITPRTRIKKLRGVAKAKKYALMRHTLEKYGIVTQWHDVFHKPYSGEPMFFWTLGSFRRFIERWITENIKTKRAREGAEARLGQVIEKALVEAEKFTQPAKKERPKFLDFVIDRDRQWYLWNKERVIFSKGKRLCYINGEYSYVDCEGRNFKDYICIMVQEEPSLRRYVWIRKDLDPVEALERIRENEEDVSRSMPYRGILDYIYNHLKHIIEIKFYDSPENNDAIEYFKKMIAAYQILYL